MPSSTFPGRWLAGTSLILGPALLLAGVLLRARFHFFFPDQLAAYDRHPALMTASYSAFAAGTVVMCPAVAALTARIGAVRPAWAACGGTLALLGLFARTFHAGVDHLAFQLVDAQDRHAAVTAVADSYQGFHIFRYASFAIMLGWIALAAGALRAGVLGRPGCLALALASALPLGVLKGTTPCRSSPRRDCARPSRLWASGSFSAAPAPPAGRRPGSPPPPRWRPCSGPSPPWADRRAADRSAARGPGVRPGDGTP